MRSVQLNFIKELIPVEAEDVSIRLLMKCKDCNQDRIEAKPNLTNKEQDGQINILTDS